MTINEISRTAARLIANHGTGALATARLVASRAASDGPFQRARDWRRIVSSVERLQELPRPGQWAGAEK
jgi:hypothetical protein